MNVRKRNGSLEPINLAKIVKAVTRSARGITDVDPALVAAKTIGGIYEQDSRPASGHPGTTQVCGVVEKE
jgi:hypothetical protein